MEIRNTNTTNEPGHRNIMCVYSQVDELFYLQLKKSLKLWERQGHVRWLELGPGDEIVATGLRYVKCADLILLLLSPDFFSDEQCYQTMHVALQERASRSVPVVPILMRAVLWQQKDLQDLPIMPHNGRPVDSWTSLDEAYASIGTDLARLVPTWQLSLPTRPSLFQAPDLPKSYVPRPQAFDEIKRKLLSQQGYQTTAITIALRGAGGFGKTTLALALCHDPEIQAAFPDGILWIILGEHPSSLLDMLNRVLVSLGVPYREALSLEEAKKRWHTALDGRVCLLVIDDVWQVEALRLLLEWGPQCVRLVTTRNDPLLPKDAARVLVDAMKPREAVTLLCQGLPEEISLATYQPQLEALVARLGNWPLLLTLARGMLTDLVEYGQSISEALTTVADAYQTRGVTAFRLDNAEERQQTVDACLRVSIQHLETFTNNHYHATECYQGLAVFPEDTDIPLTTLQMYWKSSVGLEPWETKDLCIRLHRLSLLLICGLGAGTIRLHDVLRSYLIQHAGEHLWTLHRRLLDTYQQEYGVTSWANLPRNEVYLWHRLIYHLCQAGDPEAISTTLTDLWYVTRAVLYRGVSALEADLALVTTLSPEKGAGNPPSDLPQLHRRIGRVHHLLQQVASEAEIGGLVLCAVHEEEGLMIQRQALEQVLPRPFLTTWHPLPRSSSGALVRTLSGHSSGVTTCGYSPDGRWIVSGSSDRTLKVWEATTGMEMRTLSGHSSGVGACEYSPDGRWIVSGSSDRTLKVWDATTGAEVRTLIGHSGSVNACRYSPDGRWIVSASHDQTLKVWEATTGTLVRTLIGHTDSVTACGYSPDGQWIVSASQDETLKVWEAATGAEVRTLPGHPLGGVKACGYSPDGRWIISAGFRDGTLKVWEATTGVEVRTLSYLGPPCGYSPDGRWIVSNSSDNGLSIWEVATGALVCILSGHTDKVAAFGYSPDGRRIVSASADCTLKVWEAAIGATARTSFDHTDWVWACGYSPDSRWIVSASEDKTLKVWEAATGVPVHTLFGHTDSARACEYSPDGRWIVSASFDCTLKVWEAVTGALVRTLSGHTDKVIACGYSPDGRWIVSGSADRTLKVWEAATGIERRTLIGHTSSVFACEYSPDGRWIVSASLDGTLKVWNTATGREQRTLSSNTKEVEACGYSPDGRWIVSGSDDGPLKVWDATMGAEVRTLIGHTEGVTACGYSPDGRWIVSASADCTLKVWEATTGMLVRTLIGHTSAVATCRYSPDGRWIVSASLDDTLRVWEAATGALVWRVPSGHTKKVIACRYSPDGRWIVSASWDNTLKVWETATGAEVRTLIGHIKAVWGCGYSPDGRWIVSGSSDRTLKVWDATTGAEVRTLIGHTDSVTACGYSPDSRWIVSASLDHKLRVWNAAIGIERRTLIGHADGVWACGYSPDGRWIVSASHDQTLKVWKAATGTLVRTLSGHTSAVFACGYSPDGRWIVSASWDNTLKVWDATTGAEARTLRGHTDRVNACGFSPDGHIIVSGSDDRTLKVWNAATGQCLLTFPMDRKFSSCSFHPEGGHLVACGEGGVYFLRLVQ